MSIVRIGEGTSRRDGGGVEIGTRTRIFRLPGNRSYLSAIFSVYIYIILGLFVLYSVYFLIFITKILISIYINLYK